MIKSMSPMFPPIRFPICWIIVPTISVENKPKAMPLKPSIKMWFSNFFHAFLSSSIKFSRSDCLYALPGVSLHLYIDSSSMSFQVSCHLENVAYFPAFIKNIFLSELFTERKVYCMIQNDVRALADIVLYLDPSNCFSGERM